MPRETYTVETPDETRFGAPVGLITDATTGRTTAYYRGGFSVVIGEPLCEGCDAPASDGPCGCMICGYCAAVIGDELCVCRARAAA